MTGDRSTSWGARWLRVACFLSGAAGLVFEMIWFHRTSLLFGGSVWATSLVLSSFMGGLTIGSALVAQIGRRIRNPLREYAALEVVVALSGLGLTVLLPVMMFVRIGLAAESPWLVNLDRFVTAFTLLLVPSTAMGATLPLLVAALARGERRFGSALGAAYGWNTLGAVAGVVGAEVFLIGRVGVSGTAGIAASLSLGAAAIALLVSRRAAAADPPPRTTVEPTALPYLHTWPLLACSFLAGGTLLALEVIWFRFLTMYVLSTTLAASLMLAVVLAAIGLGGLAASAWLKQSAQASTRLPAVAFAAGCAVAASYTAFQWLTAGTQIATWSGTLQLACALTVLPSLLSGVLFTLLGDTLQRTVAGRGEIASAIHIRATGWLTLANTAGGMCGPLVAAFVLLPALGMEGAFFVLAAVYAVIGILALAGAGSLRAQLRSPAVVMGGVAIAAFLTLFPFGLMRDEYFARVVQPYTADGSAIVATREGPSETIFVTQQNWLEEPVYSRLVTNGFSMSGTSATAARYMRYFVYLPMMLHDGPLKRVLVVCYGVGVTAAAALDLPSVESIDVVEISRDVVAMSDVIYPADPPLQNHRIRLHIEDGRQFLQATSERFDLITGEPPPPRTPGAVNIYTREYFQLIYDRLADGGITTYWLPVGRPDPGTNVNSIIGAFCDVFADCSLWNATPFDLMLVGTRRGEGPVSEDEFVAPWTSPHLRSRFSEVGFELPQQVGATFLGDSAYLRELVGATPSLVDNHPHRLQPIAGRPSLSDPGFGVDPDVTRLYQDVVDPARARRAFVRSTFIRGLLPERVIDGTLPYFEHQGILNRVLWEGGRPLRQIEPLHRLLTETPLRTLPLWMLGSDYVKERIARMRDDGTGAAFYARGLSALASRDYPGAASAFEAAERRGLRGEAILPLRVYALCLAGRQEAAKALASAVRPQGEEERLFWQWIGPKFGVGPFSGG